MTTFVLLELDPERRAASLDQRRTHSGAVVASMSELESYLPRHPETLLVLIGATVDLDEALTFTAYQRVQRPVIGVIVLRDEPTPDVVVQCLRAGVREVVAESDLATITTASARSIDLSKALSTTMRANSEQTQHAKIVTMFAGKGGCGKSVLAVNLAVALAAGGSRRVLLIDLDLQFGDVAIMLKLVPTRGIAEGGAMAGRLDESGLRSLLTGYRPGVDALLAPATPAESEQVGKDFVTEVLDVARRMYDFIVIDTPAFVTDQVLAALDMTDWFVPVVTPDLPALKDVRLTMEMFDLLQYPPERRLVVFNRATSQAGLTVVDVQDALGVPLAVHVPSSPDLATSVNRGEPLTLTNPGHPVSRAVRDLADKCAGVDEATVKRRGLFGRGRRR